MRSFRPLPTSFVLGWSLVAALTLAGCANGDISGNEGGEGGASPSGTGGSVGAGGSASGGSTARGGTTGTGGFTSSGGATGSGGLTATGGVTGSFRCFIMISTALFPSKTGLPVTMAYSVQPSE